MGKKPKKNLTVNTNIPQQQPSSASSHPSEAKQPLPSPSPSPKASTPLPQSSQLNEDHSKKKKKKQSSTSSSSFSPKLVFISGIVLGLVFAAALVSMYIKRNTPPPQMTLEDVEQIEHLRRLGKETTGLFEAIAYYEQAIASVPRVAKSSPQFAALLDEAGDAFHSAKKYESAEKYHRKSLEIKMKKWTSSSSPNEVIYSFVALATDLFKGGKIAEALDYVHRAQAFRNLPSNIQSMLYRLEAIIYECDGDFIMSLHRFEHALKLSPAHTHSREKQLEFLHVHRDLLRKTRLYHRVPPKESQAMEDKEKDIDRRLIEIGPWVDPLQLPKVYKANLTSKPWHDINDYPQLRQAYDIVLKHHQPLRTEYFQLQNKSLLIQEGECINDIHKGKWAVHDITSFWVPRDELGCSIAAPKGCALFRELKSIGFPVIRGGYPVHSAFRDN